MMEEIYMKLVSAFKIILNEQSEFMVEELRNDAFSAEFNLYPKISERVKTVFESAE